MPSYSTYAQNCLRSSSWVIGLGREPIMTHIWSHSIPLSCPLCARTTRISTAYVIDRTGHLENAAYIFSPMLALIVLLYWSRPPRGLIDFIQTRNCTPRRVPRTQGIQSAKRRSSYLASSSSVTSFWYEYSYIHLWILLVCKWSSGPSLNWGTIHPLLLDDSFYSPRSKTPRCQRRYLSNVKTKDKRGMPWDARLCYSCYTCINCFVASMLNLISTWLVSVRSQHVFCVW